MKQLIVNADDYGRTAQISRGIREAHTSGIVSSSTCMMTFPTAAADLRLAQAETPGLGLGVHLVLTSGKPVLEAEACRSLVGQDGEFHRLSEWSAGNVRWEPEEVRREWQAQIRAFRWETGRNPTHLDSHHHISYSSPELLAIQCDLADQYQCPVRMPLPPEDRSWFGKPPETPDSLRSFGPGLLQRRGVWSPGAFIGVFFGEHATVPWLTEILEALPEGASELMCHPGYADPDLIATSSYAQARDQERRVLTDPGVISAIAAYNIEIIPFDRLGWRDGPRIDGECSKPQR